MMRLLTLTLGCFLVYGSAHPFPTGHRSSDDHKPVGDDEFTSNSETSSVFRAERDLEGTYPENNIRTRRSPQRFQSGILGRPFGRFPGNSFTPPLPNAQFPGPRPSNVVGPGGTQFPGGLVGPGGTQFPGGLVGPGGTRFRG